MKKAILALGSNLNLNDRLNNLKNAISFLKNVPDLKICKVSQIYETEPFEVPDKQNNYYNCCILIQTNLSPFILLGACLGVEAAMGRKRPFKNASKIIDIDLIYYQGEKCDDKNLTLPHPRAKDRPFVLLPILDILSNTDPLREKIESYLRNLDVSGIKRVIKTSL
ncbi:MAG: 2-amino-4-hydroxy-6-hydroxymethyldihydropteridine diphosphokinase [Clostridia bacterium]|nr:2-amino-4-hydroxy-6-hydroxymethyldihydropteridine diphosphokinase [Clostridia bacterium]